jgi:hypothetical protein
VRKNHCLLIVWALTKERINLKNTFMTERPTPPDARRERMNDVIFDSAVEYLLQETDEGRKVSFHALQTLAQEGVSDAVKGLLNDHQVHLFEEWSLEEVERLTETYYLVMGMRRALPGIRADLLKFVEGLTDQELIAKLAQTQKYL